MAVDECDLTWLPPDMCACPKHRGGALHDQAGTVGEPFEAVLHGFCDRCDDHIHPGDQIIRRATSDPASFDGYVHSGRCPR